MIDHPATTDTIDAWLKWVDVAFPFDPREERRLKYRPDQAKPMTGSQQELADLRGVADPVNLSKPDETRTRTVAAVLARMWFHMREQERKRGWHAAQMNHQKAEQELSDFDAAIGAAPAGKPTYRHAERQGFDGETWG